MPVSEIRIAGFGGQGVILSAIIIGKAGCIYQPGYATMTQNFGPEARGGACSAQLILSDTPVLYPYVPRPDILVVMSQEAYGLFAPQLKRRRHAHHRGRPGANWRAAGGRAGLQRPGYTHRGRTGQEDGLNIVMVGFFGAITQVLDPDALRNAVGASVPQAYRELNLKAFDRGFEYGSKALTEVIVKQDSLVAVAALEN